MQIMIDTEFNLVEGWPFVGRNCHWRRETQLGRGGPALGNLLLKDKKLKPKST